MTVTTSGFPAVPSSTQTAGLYTILGVGQPDGDSQLQRWSSFIGIVTAIVGNLLISFALNTQRYAHILIEREYNEGRKSQTNGSASPSAGGYGTNTQEQIAEARRRVNLGIPDRKERHDEEDTASSGDGHTDVSFEAAMEEARQKNEPQNDDQDRPSYLRSPVWWFGLVLMIVGEIGNFLAYGFAPASIVSPLGVVALISNCLIAPLMLKERFRKRDFFGVLVAVAGAVVVVLSARSSEEKFGPGGLWKTAKRWEFLVYVIITILLIVVLMYSEPRYGRRTILVDLGLVGLFGGYTALSTKGVSSLLSTSLWKTFAYPIFYVLVVILVLSALMQIRYLNRALQNYDSTQVIPTQFVLFTLSVIIGSAVLYRDFEHTTTQQAAKFVIGCLLTFFGVYLITSRREVYDVSEEQLQDDDETIQLIDEEVEVSDERTPLNRDRKPSLPQSADDRRSILNRVDETDDEPSTPQPSRPASSVPSIAVTPAESSENLDRNPWATSVEQVDAPPPRMPQQLPSPNPPLRSGSSTPFFTPFTSRPFHRSTSSPADAETISRQNTPRHPSPERPAEDASATARLLSRSTRGSISRLIPVPGPLLPPLSSSLSALVADSLRRGEGTPWSVRASLRRSRSSRHSVDTRRQPVPVSDEENPLGLHFQNRSADHGLSRAQTHEGAVVVDDGLRDQEPPGRHHRLRLRSLSETLSGIMGRGKGKRRDDADESRFDSASAV
ncbi:uncharacterized protein PV06_01198 [Exophiala oligosperma]|uniref:Uncharacterized protein n=1 Tax=Exophiala oligosperma TaxID=215243 RepID=A0A0D2DZR2_9EURO|nr:uncharacterized protein PV06_01198 [Exophiala oligosperma]KIW48628.1 hypothetical protein PV06_01198 [Exophiala oligosperma]